MFESLTPLPPDPILGLAAAFREDSSPDKIDLGVGVYKDADGNIPVMTAVKKAEQRLVATQVTKNYVGPTGAPGFGEAAARLVFGDALVEGLGDRRVTVQSVGGCGGLRLAADFIARDHPDSVVYLSRPTWPNHAPLLGAAGLRIENYPWYNLGKRCLDDALWHHVSSLSAGHHVLLLHGCCHNPSGADLSREQWQHLRDIILERGYTVLIDLAYQGMGDGLEEDVYGVRLLAESLPELIVVSSFSKNFGLYRERIGAVHVICDSDKSAAAAKTVLAASARANYSMPPDHGAAIVQCILEDGELKLEWETELRGIRDRINALRGLLAGRLRETGAGQHYDFIERQKGMFSLLGTTPREVRTLIQDYSIYLVNSGRINVAGINESNVDYLADAVARVVAI